MTRTPLLLLLACLLLACAPASEPWPLSEPLPARLSELGLLLQQGGELRVQDGFVYTLGHPLFSDYASKHRSVHLPPGGRAERVSGADSMAALAFPPGTLITKTFLYPVPAQGLVGLTNVAMETGERAGLALAGLRLLETRVLRHAVSGWEAVSYLWDEAGREAWRADAGALLALVTEDGVAFDYLVPDRNQCAACHGTGRQQRVLMPIGPKPANLAAVRVSEQEQQYARWQAAGWVMDQDEVVAWPAQPDARAYLDVNCAHCHNGDGSAANAGLDLRYSSERPWELGVCKPPVAAGRGAGGLRVGIWPGRPEASILHYRLAHRDPAVMMPELGRSLVDEQALGLIAAWIEELQGDCTHAGMF
ncbi:MAG: hypothetical protein JJT88_19270 [Gammaproteobacteria bacterium]|nr:hypothetical protein [Gammaproteobacteria bacterium]